MNPKKMTNSFKELNLVIKIIIILFLFSLIPVFILLFMVFLPAFIFGPITYTVFKKSDKEKRKVITGVFAAITFLLTMGWVNFVFSSDSTETPTAPKEIKTETTKEHPKLTPAPTVTKKEESKPNLFLVTEVIDGDTIIIDTGGKTEGVRLIGIDTPEMSDSRGLVECFAQEAKDKLNSLLKGKKVKIESDSSQEDKDKYGRLLRYIFLDDGSFINETMILEGYAHEYTYKVPYSYQQSFKNSEATARDNKKGLWADNACNNKQNTEAISTPIATESQIKTNPGAITNEEPSSGPAVKKSKTNICHAKGTKYYNQTKYYTSYNSIDECIASGGRLPKG